jgi:hypothetical protein
MPVWFPGSAGDNHVPLRGQVHLATISSAR